MSAIVTFDFFKYQLCKSPAGKYDCFFILRVLIFIELFYIIFYLFNIIRNKFKKLKNISTTWFLVCVFCPISTLKVFVSLFHIHLTYCWLFSQYNSFLLPDYFD